MYPRGGIDAPWRLLVDAWSSTWSTHLPADIHPLGATLEKYCLPCLCVRSAWLSILDDAKLGTGDAVLMTAASIPAMADLARSTGAEVFGIDLQADSAFPRVADCETARQRALAAGKTIKVVLIAQLFGSRRSLTDIVAWAQTHQLLIIEDVAQLSLRTGWQPSPGVQASLFSFGPIKAGTAAGGGLIISAHTSYLSKLQELHKQWPVQSRKDYRGRIVKTMMLRLVAQHQVFAWLCWILARRGRTPDQFINTLSRGFPGAIKAARFRQRPCRALLRCMYRALHRPVARTAQHEQAGRRLVSWLGSRAMAKACSDHRAWVVPLICHDPAAVRAHLAKAGFDSGQRGSMQVIAEECPQATALFDALIIIPHPSYLPTQARYRLQGALSVALRRDILPAQPSST